jgi:RNA polymerase sigma factor (sigma-70 family)
VAPGRIEGVMSTAASDDDGLAALVGRRGALVRRLERRFGGRQQAEDAVQEALVRAWQLRARGDEVSSWDAWVATTAANAVRAELRSRDAERRALGRLAAPGHEAARGVDGRHGSHAAAADAALGGSLAAGDVGDAVRRLPAREREVVVLHYVADLPVADVAERLGVAPGTVKRALHDARRRLAATLAPPPAPGRRPTSRTPRRNPVHGWIMAGSHREEYEFEVDRSSGAARDGAPVCVLRSTVRKASGFGTVMQMVQARKYVGSRLRFSGDAAVEDVDGWFGLWLRVDGERQNQPLAFDNMESRPLRGTRGWGRYEVVLDVPEGATAVALGFLLVGTGTGRVSGLRLEEVGEDVPVTGHGGGPLPDEPVNLGFADD